MDCINKIFNHIYKCIEKLGSICDNGQKFLLILLFIIIIICAISTFIIETNYQVIVGLMSVFFSTILGVLLDINHKQNIAINNFCEILSEKWDFAVKISEKLIGKGNAKNYPNKLKGYYSPEMIFKYTLYYFFKYELSWFEYDITNLRNEYRQYYIKYISTLDGIDYGPAYFQWYLQGKDLPIPFDNEKVYKCTYDLINNIKNKVDEKNYSKIDKIIFEDTYKKVIFIKLYERVPLYWEYENRLSGYYPITNLEQWHYLLESKKSY